MSSCASWCQAGAKTGAPPPSHGSDRPWTGWLLELWARRIRVAHWKVGHAGLGSLIVSRRVRVAHRKVGARLRQAAWCRAHHVLFQHGGSGGGWRVALSRCCTLPASQGWNGSGRQHTSTGARLRQAAAGVAAGIERGQAADADCSMLGKRQRGD